MATNRKWMEELKHHHRQAVDHHQVAHEKHYGDPMAALYLSATAALVVIAGAQLGQLAELKRIRRLLEHQHPQHDNQTVAFNATVTLVPKDGGSTMPLPVQNPTETQDVAITIAPTNRGGLPTTGPFTWDTNNPAQLTAQPSADGKSCLLVTAAGAIDAIATVHDSVSGNTDTFSVQRGSITPPDNVTTAFNAQGSVVEKGAVPPAFARR